jgi:uncharacterized pyridoxamine 5'-phosphate oxidase family protein
MKRLFLSLLAIVPIYCAGQSVAGFTLQQALELLPVHTAGYFATLDGDKPDLRGWQYQGYENGKFIFATSNEKAVYRQMQKQANVAFACSAGDYLFRINGKATFVTDATEKKRLFGKLSPSVQQMYRSWDNPILAIFTVSDGELRIAKGFGPFQPIKY